MCFWHQQLAVVCLLFILLPFTCDIKQCNLMLWQTTQAPCIIQSEGMWNKRRQNETVSYGIKIIFQFLASVEFLPIWVYVDDVLTWHCSSLVLNSVKQGFSHNAMVSFLQQFHNYCSMDGEQIHVKVQQLYNSSPFLHTGHSIGVYPRDVANHRGAPGQYSGNAATPNPGAAGHGRSGSESFLAFLSPFLP